MAKNTEIKSTEKLLGVIRGGADGGSASGSDTVTASKVKRKSAGLSVLSLTRESTVGVDIGPERLTLAKTSRGAGSKMQLREYTVIPFEPGMTRDSPQFPAFFKSHLERFIHRDRGVKVWGIISAAAIEIRCLRIPKVARKQIANAVYWTFKKEGPFNEEEAILDFEVLGEVVEDGVTKMEVAAYTAPIRDIQDATTLYRRCGFSIHGVTSVPFAVQNLFRAGWIETPGKNVCALYVGRNWSRIDIFSDNNLVLSRGIKAGINSMVESIWETLNEGQVDGPEGTILLLEHPESSQTFESAGEYEREEARTALFELLETQSPTIELPGRSAIREEDLFEMILPALDRLVRQVERTLEHYYLNFKAEPISGLYFTGQVGAYRRLTNYVGEQLNVPVETVNPFTTEEYLGPGVTAPKSVVTRTDLTPVLGLALSQNSITPNFIFTYQDKQQEANDRRIGWSLFVAFLVVAGILAGLIQWQSHSIKKNRALAADLTARLESFEPQADREYISLLLTRLGHTRRRWSEYRDKYSPVAVMSELSELTPPGVRLIDMTLDLGRFEAPKPVVVEEGADDGTGDSEETGTPKEKKKPRKTLVLNGMVLGRSATYEAVLAEYLLRLESSPMFSRPKVEKKSIQTIGSQEALRFVARLDLT